MNFDKNIEIVPGKRGGKPCIKGTRITVADVLSWLASGMSKEQLFADYPELTNEQVAACLEYASNNETRAERAISHNPQSRVADLCKGQISTTDDFDDHLGDAFWLGSDL